MIIIAGNSTYGKSRRRKYRFIYTVLALKGKTLALRLSVAFHGLKEALVATKNNMTLLLATENETQTGLSYTSYTAGGSGTQKAKLANIVYIDENGKNYLSWMEDFAPALPPGTETKATIKITEATADHIKGSFFRRVVQRRIYREAQHHGR